MQNTASHNNSRLSRISEIRLNKPNGRVDSHTLVAQQVTGYGILSQMLSINQLQSPLYPFRSSELDASLPLVRVRQYNTNGREEIQTYCPRTGVGNDDTADQTSAFRWPLGLLKGRWWGDDWTLMLNVSGEFDRASGKNKSALQSGKWKKIHNESESVYTGESGYLIRWRKKRVQSLTVK